MPDNSKIIRIERPAYLSHCRKEPIWDYDGVDIRQGKQWMYQATKLMTLDGGPTNLSTYVKASRLLDGAQVMVDQRVSIDLEISTVIGDLGMMTWPSPTDVIEMRFQDPDLPTILVLNQLDKDDSSQKGLAFVMDDNNRASITLSVNAKDWKALADGQYKEDMVARCEHDLELETEELEAIRYMAMLAIKVIAYSSVTHHKPALLTTRAERKAVGFHPKHIREQDKYFSIRYLPRVIRDKPDTPSEPTGLKRRFLGRGGVLRFYEHERYVNMRGQWQWIPPIPTPEGIQVIVKVRKV